MAVFPFGSVYLVLATGWTIRVCFLAGAGDFSFRKMSSQPPGSTQPAIQWLPRVKQLVYEADHLCTSGAEAKKEQSCISSPSYVFMECKGTAFPYIYTQF
jgi:hypothetical protein